MPGGEFDSSKTRVTPVFDQLRQRQDDWVRRLVALPQHGTGRVTPAEADLAFVRGYWGATERALFPPVSLLSWLVRNLTVAPGKSVEDERRVRLAAGDPATIASALTALRTAGTGKAWHVLEGPSYPDVFIETPAAIIVIEGKRTEPAPTTHTTWMANRHQMWRHMDAAWEIRGCRLVLGFFIVEGSGVEGVEVPDQWVQAARDTMAPTAIAGSFPHRSKAERDAITSGFLGVTTWQAVCATFRVDYASLPVKVIAPVEEERPLA